MSLNAKVWNQACEPAGTTEFLLAFVLSHRPIAHLKLDVVSAQAVATAFGGR
jgi:hypothetical protein